MKIKNTDFLFAENPNPMWIFDPADLSIHQVNDAACDLYGYSEEEFLALSIADLRPEEEIPKLMEEVAKDIDSFSNAGIWKHRKKNGELLFVRILSYPITREGKKFELIAAHDVTNKIEYREELHMVLENSLDGIMLTSPDGRIHRANKAACQILGRSEEQIKELGRDGLVHNDEKLQEALKNRSQTGEFSGELTFIHSSGRRIPVDLTTSVYKDPQGQLRTSMIFRDITQRKQTEQELQESIDRYYYATKATQDAVYDWDIVNDQLYLGEGFNDIFGYDVDKQSISLEEYTHFVHPDDHPKVQKSLDKTLIDPSLNYWSNQYRFKKSDGQYAQAVESGYIIRNDEGIAIRMIGAIRDVTERKKADQTLHEMYQRNRLILESTGEGIYGIDTEGLCTFINKAAANMLGYEPEQCIGKNMHILIHHKFADGSPYPESECPIFVSKNKHEGCRVMDEVFWRADGTSFEVEYTSNPMIEDGEIKGAVVAFSDITERKQKEAQLQETLKEKETLLAEIHHRVKNNLAVVSGMIQLQAFQEEDDSLKHKLDDSISRIKTIANIHEILYKSNSFSRLNLDENINRLVVEIAQTYQLPIEPKITFDLQKIDLNINQAIPVSLIVNEVVTNVFKHAFNGKDQGKLWVKMAETNQTITLQIMDNGKGLPANFSETENTSSLGLQLIDILTQQLEGENEFESADGKTRFALTFEKKETKGSGSTFLQ